MGTRGLMGLRVNDTDKLTYNHFDSYPDGLGCQMVEDLHALLRDPAAFRASAEALRLVDANSHPTADDIARLWPFSDTDVGTRQLDDWYVLLRRTQGHLGKALEAGVMIENSAFAADSLFCEWGYVANLDDQTLEIYRGFQDVPHTKGRFASLPLNDTGYHPIALIGTLPFAAIAENKVTASAALMAIAAPVEETGVPS